MESNVIELPCAARLAPSPPPAGLHTRLSLAVRTFVHHARRLLDRLAAVLGYSRSEHAAFERWLNAAGGGLYDEVPRPPSNRRGRLIDFEAARAARAARRG